MTVIALNKSHSLLLHSTAHTLQKSVLSHKCCCMQEFVNPLDKVLARGGADFNDALRALRVRALGRRKTSL